MDFFKLNYHYGSGLDNARFSSISNGLFLIPLYHFKDALVDLVNKQGLTLSWVGFLKVNVKKHLVMYAFCRK